MPDHKIYPTIAECSRAIDEGIEQAFNFTTHRLAGEQGESDFVPFE